MTLSKNARFAQSGFAAIIAVSGCFVACSGAAPGTGESIGTGSQALSDQTVLFGVSHGMRRSAIATTGLVTISGNVMDPTGFSLSGVKITLNGGKQASVVTDASGDYSFSVSPGSYTVSASGTCASFEPSLDNLNGIKKNTVVDFVGSGGSCPPAPSSGAASGSLTIAGHVTAGGSPVPGARVTLNGGTQAFRTSDETGAYSFSVNPGSYAVSTSGGCASYTPGIANLSHVTKNSTLNFQGSGSCPPPPLALCPTFDARLGSPEPAQCDTLTTNACSDRLSGWVSTIVFDFASAVSNDCRFGQWVPPTFPAQASTDYLNALSPFTLQLFGCAFQGTLVGPIFDGLVPTFFSSHQFTTADLDALSSSYVAAVQQALSDAAAPPLSAAQLTALQAQLAYAQSKVPHTVSSSTLTFSTCGDGGV